MSDTDIDALLQQYRNQPKISSNIQDRIDWLDREKTYRQTQKDIANSEGAYEDLVRGTKTLDRS
jgi:hypothetical protein